MRLAADSTILAMDASTPQAGLALWQGGACKARRTWPATRGNPGQLVQNIVALRQTCNLAWNQIDAILVGCGPGQYAGLRVSVAVAQGLQLPGRGRVMGMESPYAMLAQTRDAHPEAPAIIICGDARRNHVWLYLWSKADTPLSPALRCIEMDACKHLSLPAGSVFASPDFGRLLNRMPIPGTASWVETDIFPEPDNMIRTALETPALLTQPEICYVHPPVFVEPRTDFRG